MRKGRRGEGKAEGGIGKRRRKGRRERRRKEGGVRKEEKERQGGRGRRKWEDGRTRRRGRRTGARSVQVTVAQEDRKGQYRQKIRFRSKGFPRLLYVCQALWGKPGGKPLTQRWCWERTNVRR